MTPGAETSAPVPNRSTVLRPARDVRFRIVDGEAVVLRQQEGETLVLNGVGARILELLDGARDLEAVAEQILIEYEVEPEEAAADVLEFAADLLQIGLVDDVSPTSATAGDAAR